MLGSTSPRRAALGMGVLLVCSLVAPAAQAAPAVVVSGSRPVLEAASVQPNGRTSGFLHSQPSVSDDGQRVAFVSPAGTLVPGVTGDCPQVYVRDRARNVTVLVSSGEDGAPASGGNCSTGGYPWTPMSGDGKLVAFVSEATSLLRGPGDPGAHVFVKHLDTGRLERIAVPVEANRPKPESRAVAAVSMSADGRYLAATVFLGQNGPNNVGYVYDRNTRTWQRICQPGAMRCVVAAVSPDGRYVAYAFEPRNIDPDSRPMPYIFDRTTGQSRRVAARPARTGHFLGRMQFSDDGRSLFLSWQRYDPPESGAITVHRTGDFAQEELISFPGLSGAVDVDRTGRRLAISYSSRIRPFAWTYDAAVYDRVTRRVTIASVTPDGERGNAVSGPGGITPDGRTVVMFTNASNLAPGDRLGRDDDDRDAVIATFPPRRSG